MFSNGKLNMKINPILNSRICKIKIKYLLTNKHAIKVMIKNFNLLILYKINEMNVLIKIFNRKYLKNIKIAIRKRIICTEQEDQ